MSGKNEEEFKQLANWLGAYTLKKPDMGKCWRCGAPRFDTKTDAQDKREVKASMVDYFVELGSRHTWVECKSGTNAFHWADDDTKGGKGIRRGQRLFMNDRLVRGIDSWIFLTLGTGRAGTKDGRESYLILWRDWLRIESMLIQREMQSIPWKQNQRKNSILNVKDCFSRYLCPWQNHVGWTLSNEHPFWKAYCQKDVQKPFILVKGGLIYESATMANFFRGQL